ncbi:MAG: AMP-binding protein [Gammaproteobacteria bacterium]|nr:AMP-binding protein [Gammaproteobacteria bacterium]
MSQHEPRTGQTLAQVLEKRAATLADKAWIVTPGETVTFAQMALRATRLAYGFRTLQIDAGDTVLLMLPDGLPILLAWCALAKFGAIEVPVNTRLRGNVLAHIVNDSRASTIVVHGDYLPQLTQVAEQLRYLRRVVLVEGDAVMQMLPGELRHCDLVRFGDLCDVDEQAALADPSYRGITAVMYTSGTTGPSKGVMITHAHAYEYALGVAESLELRESDVYYNPLPLFHIAGQWAAVYACLITGATVVLPPAFTLDGFWADVQRHRATCTFLLGAMANWLYRQSPSEAERNNTMQRMLVVPLLPEIEDFKRRFDCLVSTTWGSTEINVPTRSSFELANNKTCGYVASDRYQVRIVDENDEECPPGVPGEAAVRAHEPWILMAGYWNNPEATVHAWRNQWVRTGDMLMRDESGNLYFVDRLNDAIRRRGENISSMEVEAELNAHPAVLESAVIPIASEHTEQDVMAVLVLREGADLDVPDMLEFLEPRMAKFMVPRYFDVVPELPKTQTGKIQKFALRERGLTPTTWDREVR